MRCATAAYLPAVRRPLRWRETGRRTRKLWHKLASWSAGTLIGGRQRIYRVNRGRNAWHDDHTSRARGADWLYGRAERTGWRRGVQCTIRRQAVAQASISRTRPRNELSGLRARLWVRQMARFRRGWSAYAAQRPAQRTIRGTRSRLSAGAVLRARPGISWQLRSSAASAAILCTALLRTPTLPAASLCAALLRQPLLCPLPLALRVTRPLCGKAIGRAVCTVPLPPMPGGFACKPWKLTPWPSRDAGICSLRDACADLDVTRRVEPAALAAAVRRPTQAAEQPHPATKRL